VTVLVLGKTRKSATMDYVLITKPRSIFPHLLTAAAAMFLAVDGLPDMRVLAVTLAGGGIVAAAANTFNSYFDRDIDAMMVRTRNRPLPAGRLASEKALLFGASLAVVGSLILGIGTNWFTAVLAVLALTYYVLVYTLFLKRRTCWSTILGSGIGALPPLIGWLAIRSDITPVPFLLALIVIVWTVPHFWTLAAYRQKDYAKAGLQMAPIKGVEHWVAACAMLLAAMTIILYFISALATSYLMIAGMLNAILLYLAVLNLSKKPHDSVRLYRYSIVYIALLFFSIIVDRML
jgi:heme o synthase